MSGKTYHKETDQLYASDSLVLDGGYMKRTP
jgi:hypothetical protein